MQPRHYFHVYAAGAWECPVREHIAALAEAGLRADTTIGLVGTPGERHKAREVIGDALADVGLPAPAGWVEADEGWEQVTLQQIHLDVQKIPGEYPVLYAHTKGASDDTALNAAWRRAMTRELVGGWQHCTALLADGYDTAGCHWVSAGGPSFYGGNFWWATAEYLRRLPAPDSENRWRAETWVSSDSSPRVADLKPGWPRYE